MHSNNAELYIAAHEVRILASILTKIATRDLEQRLGKHGINISSLQYGMLHLLHEHAHTGSELSRKMQLTPATLVPAVDTLERQGLIERGRDPLDRRRTPLLITEQGQDLLQRVPFANNDDALAQSLAHMGAAKRTQVVELLRELVALVSHDEALPQRVGASVQQMLIRSSEHGATTSEQV